MNKKTMEKVASLMVDDIVEKVASTRWMRELTHAADNAVKAAPGSAEQRAAASTAGKIRGAMGASSVSAGDLLKLKTIREGVGRPVLHNSNMLKDEARPLGRQEAYGGQYGRYVSRDARDDLRSLLDEQQKRNAQRASGNIDNIIDSYRGR